jgi:hypothetical protein
MKIEYNKEHIEDYGSIQKGDERKSRCGSCSGESIEGFVF